MDTKPKQRINIGLFYQNDEAWIGGTYYLMNLVQALNTCEDALRPKITVLSNKRADFEQLAQQTNYPYLDYANTEATPSLFQRLVNKVLRPILKRNVFEARPALDVVFPLRGQKYLYFTELCKERISWIPDFQEEFLPDLFDAADLEDRRKSHRYTAQHLQHLVLSSEAAAADFKQFYGDIAQCNLYVLPFAVTHDVSYKQLDINILREKYNLPKRYYFAPNQFWKHKNHWLILRAMSRLKVEGSDVVMVFSGKELDYRHPQHVEELKAYVRAEGLEDKVRFLGFIDRQDQLALMLHAKAVVQASLFEGWSTVVEDAKAVGQFLIVSDLAVHREQLEGEGRALFFDARDEAALAACLAGDWERERPRVERDYEIDKRRFGNNFMRMIRSILGYN